MKYILLLCFLIPSIGFAQVVSIVSYNVVATVQKEISIKEKIAKEFKDVPRMMDVIYCESKFQQFGKDGKVLKSRTSDYGVGQINKVHLPEAKRLGLDIFNSVDDNIKMMRIIYDKQGINAWVCNGLV